MPVNMAGLGSGIWLVSAARIVAGSKVGSTSTFKATRGPRPRYLGHDIFDRKGTEADLSGGHG